MKVLKWIFIILGVIFFAFIGFNAVQDNNIEVEESIEINAPASVVYAEIIDFKAWDEWSAWSKMDPNMEQTFEGEPGTVGHKNAWVSSNENVGIGSQEIVELRENEYMKCQMIFEGFGNENYASFNLTEADGKTKLVWDFKGDEIPFMLRFLVGMIKPEIEKSYQSSLSDLKKVIESKPIEIPNPMNLEVVDMDEIHIISIRDTTTSGEISNTLRDLYTQLAIYMGSHEAVKMDGMPIGIYHHYSEEMVDLEAAFPVTVGAESEDKVVARTVPAGKALKGVHLGDYNASETIHMAMESYSNASSDINLQGMCIEIYANDPELVDSADVRTEIYYPLK